MFQIRQTCVPMTSLRGSPPARAFTVQSTPAPLKFWQIIKRRRYGQPCQQAIFECLYKSQKGAMNFLLRAIAAYKNILSRRNILLRQYATLTSACWRWLALVALITISFRGTVIDERSFQACFLFFSAWRGRIMWPTISAALASNIIGSSSRAMRPTPSSILI